MTTEHQHSSGLPRLVRSLDLLWDTGGKGSGDRPARGPKPGLTLERIVTTAIDVANREGLAALSMRKVAAELGVGTMSLYRYVPGKSELIDLMADHANAPAEDSEGDGPEERPDKGWRARVEDIAQSAWDTYTTNPWLLQVNQARPVLGPGSMGGFDVTLRALEGLGLTGKEKVGLLVAVDNLVVGAARGHVLHHQEVCESGVTDEEFWGAQEPYMVRAMEGGVYPRIAALDEDSFTMGGEEQMRFGLAALLDGFETLIAHRGQPPTP